MYRFILYHVKQKERHDHLKLSLNSGPSKAVFVTANESVTNVTGLTKGEYVFKLTIVDDNGNKNSDTVQVTVTQSEYFIRIY